MLLMILWSALFLVVVAFCLFVLTVFLQVVFEMDKEPGLQALTVASYPLCLVAIFAATYLAIKRVIGQHFDGYRLLLVRSREKTATPDGSKPLLPTQESCSLENPQQPPAMPLFLRDFSVILLLCFAFEMFDGYFVFQRAVWLKQWPLLRYAEFAAPVVFTQALVCTWVYRYAMRTKQSPALFLLLSLFVIAVTFLMARYAAQGIAGSPSVHGPLIVSGTRTPLGQVDFFFSPLSFMALYAAALLVIDRIQKKPTTSRP